MQEGGWPRFLFVAGACGITTNAAKCLWVHLGMWWCCGAIVVCGSAVLWWPTRATPPQGHAASSVAPLERRRADNRALSASSGPLVPHQAKPEDSGCIPACGGAVLTSVSVRIGRTSVIHVQSRPKAVLQAVQRLWNARGPITALSLRHLGLWYHTKQSQKTLGACGHVVVLCSHQCQWE